ncbi:beta-glucosidase family protein [Paenibacillus lutimineralis]|uniref:Glycosyl hydrolase n=1 Tax=Paenibacillus lutimineralis TaxID=2707005 RepID=A0A3S9UVI3_9BACL|nr:glycoside hydrolase family 3 C-terminal domain-containing protein [Paenibacillus lutimineralis]AZS14320.1 glycosyl hydrolase [Paenibacillus lutimineralis]
MTMDMESRLRFTQKAETLVAEMTLEEKVHLMSGQVSAEQMFRDFIIIHYNHVPYPAGGIERLQVPAMKFVDGPRGVVSSSSTCFPVSMARGATFDPDLERRIGVAIAKEIRAQGGNLFGGVCVNLPRHPGWGRSQETYGEDSFHLGAMGASLVVGVQSEQVIACVKHFAFNSMENARFKVNVTADKRTEREVYFPHFKACIDAGAAAVMSAYNLYDGAYCGHNDYLLNQVLRHEWGFDGFVISDFVWGIRDTVKAVHGGMDIEMCDTKYYGQRLVDAVRSGQVAEEKIDQAAIRIVRTLLAFTAQPEQEYGPEVVASTSHIALALEAAEKSMTLMKNDHAILPFSKSARKVAVIGKLGKQANIGDHGSSRVFPPYAVTPLEGIQRLLPEAEVCYDDGTDLQRAGALARESDAVICVVGYNHNDEGEYVTDVGSEEFKARMATLFHKYPEVAAKLQSHTPQERKAVGGDRKSLGLHADEAALLQELGSLNPNTAVVLIGGNTIMIEEWKDYVPAILMAYYPGMEGGTAIAKTLFGDVNPGGKLPYVTPVDERHLPDVDWDASTIEYGYYHGYTKLEKEGISPSLPYGFGLSYTTFQLEDPRFERQGTDVVASCTVHNTGEREGDEVVQLYIGFSQSQVDRPHKSLKGFERITLKPGKRQRVQLSCPIDSLHWYNPQTDQWELEAMVHEVYIGNSSAREGLLVGTVDLRSSE